MRTLLKALLLTLLTGFPIKAGAAGLGCQDTVGNAPLEKIRANATGTYMLGCINRSFDKLVSSYTVLGSSANYGQLILQSTTTTPNHSVLKVLTNSTYTILAVNQSGNVGIGTAVPQGKLDVQGDLYVGNGSNLARLKSDGTSTFLDAIPGSGSIVFRPGGAVEQARLLSSGNFGINTTNPATRLDLIENLSSGGSQNVARFSAGDGGGSNFSRLSVQIATGTAGNSMAAFNSSSSGSPATPDIAFKTDGTERMRIIASNGIMSIGAAAVSQPYTLEAVHVNGVFVSSTSSGGGIIMAPSSLVPTRRVWGILSNFQVAGNLDFFHNASGVTDPIVNPTVRMSINSSGDVGMGTTTPGSKLEISSSNAAAYSASSSQSNVGPTLSLSNPSNTDNSIAQIVFQHRASGAGFARIVAETVSGGDNVNLRFVTEGSGVAAERMVIAANGNVGIGTTSPGAPLHVFTSAGSRVANFDSSAGAGPYITLLEAGVDKFYIGNSAAVSGTSPGGYDVWSNTALKFFTDGNAATRMIINTSGDIGINTTTPSSKLEVKDGDIRISTTTGSRGIIFQDGSTMVSAATGGGNISGTLTTGKIPKATATNTIADSVLTERGHKIFVASATASASTTITFSGLTSSTTYVLRYWLTCGSMSTGDHVAIRYNGDTGANYFDNFTTARSDGANTLDFTTGGTYIRNNFSTGGCGSGMKGEVEFSSAYGNSITILTYFHSDYLNGANSQYQASTGGGKYTGAANLSSVSLVGIGGDFTGSVYLYSIHDAN